MGRSRMLGVVGTWGVLGLGCTPNPGGIAPTTTEVGSDTGTEGPTTAPSSTGAPDTTTGALDDTSTATTATTASTASSDSGEPEPFFRREIIINGDTVTSGDGPLLDFTVQVVFAGDEGLRHVDFGGNVLDPDGVDLVFRDTDLQPLGRELMSYGDQTGRLVTWVRVPELATDGPTTIYLDYGAPSLVGLPPAEAWNDDYVGVWHFEDEVLNGAMILDSGVHGNHGTALNMDPTDGGLPARAGSGVSFSKDGATIEIADGSLDLPGPFTFEGWGRMNGPLVNTGFQRLFHKGGALDAPMLLWVGDPTVVATHPFGQYTLGTNYDTPPSQEVGYPILGFGYGQWHHYAAVMGGPGEEAVLLVDGMRVASEIFDDLIDTGYTTLHFGNQDSTGLSQRWNGVIDEFRFSTVARSDAWVEAGWRTVNDPVGFATVGDEQSLP